MKKPFQVRRYRKSDKEEVFAFLRESYSSADYNRLASQWDWKYDDNPFNRYSEPYILLLKVNDKITGMLGGIPLRVSNHGKEHWVTNTCDLMINPTYRGQRLSQELIGQYLEDHPIRFSWLNEISKHISDPLVISQYFDLRFLIKLLDAKQIIFKMTGHNRISRWVALWMSKIKPLIPPFSRRYPSKGITVTQIETFDERVDLLWKRVRQDHPVIIVRDRSYLNWRFSARPDAQYTILSAMKGDALIGYLILRLCERAGIQCGYLVDFMTEAKNPLPFKLLVDEAIDYMRNQHAGIMISLSTMRFYRRLLYRRGFFPWRFERRGYFRPSTSHLDHTLKDFRNPWLWHLTMGDGDLEMSF